MYIVRELNNGEYFYTIHLLPDVCHSTRTKYFFPTVVDIESVHIPSSLARGWLALKQTDLRR